MLNRNERRKVQNYVALGASLLVLFGLMWASSMVVASAPLGL